MPDKFKITLAPAKLHEFGWTFWESGTLNRGGVKLYDYYRGAPVTEAQREAIRAWCPDALIGEAFVAFPKAAYFRLSPKDRTKLKETTRA